MIRVRLIGEDENGRTNEKRNVLIGFTQLNEK